MNEAASQIEHSQEIKAPVLDIPRMPTLPLNEQGGALSITAEELAQLLGDKTDFLAKISSLNNTELQAVADAINPGKNAAEVKTQAVQQASRINVTGEAPFDVQAVLPGYFFVYKLQRYP